MTKKTQDLGRLTRLALQAAQAEMRALTDKENALRENLAQLTAQKTDLARIARASDDPALIAGADLRWQYWVDGRRAAINLELAQVLAQRDDCRHRLRLAFGRDQAAIALHRLADLSARQIAKRKAAYES
jgi:hypothetical protein